MDIAKVLFLFHISNIKTKKGFQLVEALLIVIKTYGLAIDREVSFIMSPSSDKAMDNVFSSSIVKLAEIGRASCRERV